MPKSLSHSIPEESHLSRKDIELLAKVAGGQEALIAQVNSLQLSQSNQVDALRLLIEEQRQDHNDQMKTLNTKVESLELWRVTTITPERIIRWDLTADRVESFLERYKGVAWLWGVVLFVLSIAGGWIVTNIITPLFQGGK